MSIVGSYCAKKNRKLYGNCQVHSPDNILMFRCDEKRINWYLQRNLAEVINKDPLTIRLKFKPKGLGNHQKPFGLNEMINVCVNCGTNQYLTKHHVVPLCYRRHFPTSLKSHTFHDVLSLCVYCHENYERKADLLKLKLSHNYEAPIGGQLEKSNQIKYIKISKTLIGETEYIPKKRLDYLKKQIKDFYEIKRLSLVRLKKIANIKPVVSKTHGEIVYEKIDSIQDFVEMWRTHFLENNNCLFLPKNWSIKTKINNEY